MAKQMQFTDGRGNEYSASYWRVTNCVISPELHSVDFTFKGYKDRSARDTDKQPIGEHRYILSGSDYDAQFSAAAQKAKGKNLVEMCYDYATANRDADGNYFFASATDILN